MLGKLAATSLNAFYGMLALFPVLGLCLLLGGVSPGEFWRVALVSVNNLLFSLAAGMFCSSVSKDALKAMGVTFLIVLLAAVLPVIEIILQEACGYSVTYPSLFLPSPSYSCWMAFDIFYSRVGAGGFLSSLLAVHGLTWLFLVLACLITPRTWQEKSGRHGRPSLRERWQQWQFGAPDQRLALRRQLLHVNPFLWLTSRERFNGALVWAGLALGAGIWIWGYLKLPKDWPEMACIPAALIAHTMLKGWLAGDACRRLSEDRRSGALELLLATPLTVNQILRGQRLALWRQFAGPTVAVLAIDVLFMSGGLGTVVGSYDQTWTLVWLAGMGMLVWDLFALSWVSMWMGLNSRTANRAYSAALVRICLLPWLVFGLGATLLAFLEVFSRSSAGFRITAEHAVVVWFLIGAVNNILFGVWAKRRLATQFRNIATRRFDARGSGEWGRVLGEWWAKK